MLILQVKTGTDWETLTSRMVGSSLEAELQARVELVVLRNRWAASNYFTNGSFRIVRGKL
jgi:hypothetical protein